VGVDPRDTGEEFAVTSACYAARLRRLNHAGQARMGRQHRHAFLAPVREIATPTVFMGGADTYTVYASELEGTTRLLRDGQYTTDVVLRLRCPLAEQGQMAGASPHALPDEPESS
jgi:hypothetical protein